MTHNGIKPSFMSRPLTSHLQYFKRTPSSILTSLNPSKSDNTCNFIKLMSFQKLSKIYHVLTQWYQTKPSIDGQCIIWDRTWEMSWLRLVITLVILITDILYCHWYYNSQKVNFLFRKFVDSLVVSPIKIPREFI